MQYPPRKSNRIKRHPHFPPFNNLWRIVLLMNALWQILLNTKCGQAWIESSLSYSEDRRANDQRSWEQLCSLLPVSQKLTLCLLSRSIIKDGGSFRIKIASSRWNRLNPTKKLRESSLRPAGPEESTSKPRRCAFGRTRCPSWRADLGQHGSGKTEEGPDVRAALLHRHLHHRLVQLHSAGPLPLLLQVCVPTVGQPVRQGPLRLWTLHDGAGGRPLVHGALQPVHPPVDEQGEQRSLWRNI